MKKIFISGPMTGLPKFNFEAFLEAEKMLKKCGFYVVNPVHICRKYKVKEVLANRDIFDKMINEELDELSKCDCIYMLKGWEYASGAIKEWNLAKDKKLEFKYQ